MAEGTGAQWAADPSGVHEHRYWDGTQWTDHVSDGGQQTIDPMDPPPPPSTPAPTPVPPVTTPAATPVPPPPVTAPGTGDGDDTGKKRKKWPWIVAAVVVVIIIAAVAGGSKDDKKDVTDTTTTTATALPFTDASTTTTTAAAPAGPIFTQTGNGTASTAKFKVPNDWDLAWSYDCRNFFGGTGNFIVTIYDADDSNPQVDFDNPPVNQLGASGIGTERYHSGGNTKYLQISSECSWTVTVTKG